VDADTDREFTEFVTQRTQALLRVAYALTGDQHAAEDLLQSALAKAFTRWSRIRGEAEPYVKRILYHDHVSGWRRRRIRPEALYGAVPEPGAAHAATVAAAVDGIADTPLRLLLRDALLALPPRQRAVLVLRYLEDLSTEQTAQVLGCRAGTVASQASRALARLRELVPELDGPLGNDAAAPQEERQALR
jgi:RNA polymerase sigma-70 factor (sigma-E family)